MKNGNEPAAPIKLNERVEDTATCDVKIHICEEYFEGLTKREHIAGLAMQAILSRNGQISYELLAERATEAADALLKELDK